MKQYRTLAAIGFILFLSWTLFICHAVSQVKFTQLERSSIKWTIPVAKRVVPGIPDFVMTYMTLANLIDSTEIELGTKIDSMKWATGDTLKLYTSDGVFKTKITFAGMGTVTDVTGTSPIIITGTSTVTPNVTIQNATTSQSGALTSTDWNTFNNKENALTFTSPLSRSGNTISIPAATSSVSGHLTSADWTTFNNKLSGSGANTQAAYFTASNTLASNSSFTYASSQWNMIGRFDLRQTATNFSVCIGSGSGNVGTSTGGDNFWLGRDTGKNNTSGHSNFAGGVNALYSNLTGFNNTCIGINSMFYNTSGSDNLAMGAYALSLNTDGFYNTALSPTALFNNTSGYANVAIGYNSMLSNQTGISNLAAGWRSLYSNVSGNYNVSLGDFSLYNTTGGYNVGLGYYAGGQNTSASNRLYIENSNSETPLIGGDFSANRVGINTPIASITETLHVTGNIRGTAAYIDATNSPGTSGQVLSSTVTGTDWIDLSAGDITAVTVSAPITGGGTSGSVNIGISQATTSTDGYLSSTNWNTFNNKEPAITPGTTSQYWRGDKTWQTLNTGVTTLAAIGATANANGATISGSTLNLQPASASFGGVMTTGTQTIAGAKTFSYLGGAPSGGNSLVVADPNGRLENLYGATVGHVPKWNGTAFTLQADATGASGITSLGGLTGATQTLAYATSGTTPSWLSTGTSHTFRLPAGATGEVLKWSSGDWRPGFPISLTTTGTSGNATYNSTTGVLNIPNYAGAAGEQFWTTTTTSTSHEIILKDHAGTTNVSALKLIEGAGVELSTSAGTFSNSNLTINTVGTAVGQMHKEGVTTVSFTAVTPQKVALTTSFTSGSGISTSDANDRITVASSGKYMITYSLDVDMNATTFGLTAYVKVSGSTDLSASYKQYNNDTNLTPLSKTFYVDLTAGQYIELWLSNSHTVSTNSLWDPILTIQRVQ